MNILWLKRSVIGAALAFVGLAVLWPYAHLLLLAPDPAFGQQGAWAVLGDPYYAKRLALTLAQGCAAALLCGLWGSFLAWCLWLLPLPARAWWSRILLLPFLLPTVVVGLALQDLVGDAVPPWLQLLWGYAFYNLGLVTWMVWQAMQRIPAHCLDAALGLGAKPWQAMLYVVWPLVRPTVFAAMILVFLLCAGSFGLALILGGREWATLEVEIYTLSMQELEVEAAALLSALQMFFFALLAWVHARCKAPAQLPANQRSSHLAQHWPLRFWVRYAALALFGAALGLVLLPLLALLWRCASQIPQSGPALWADTQFFLAIKNSLLFASSAALPTLALGVGIAWLGQKNGGPAHAEKYRKHSVLGWVLAGLPYLPFVLSSSVLSLALLLAYPAMAGSSAVLLAAYMLMAYPYIARNTALAMQQCNLTQYEAALGLGARPGMAFVHGLWPQMQGLVRTGFALAYVSMLGEFGVALFLTRPEWITLSTYIYENLGRVGQEQQSKAIAAAVLLTLISSACFALIAPRHKAEA